MARFAPCLKNRTNGIAPIACGRLSPPSRPLTDLRDLVRIFGPKETVEQLSQDIISMIIVYHFWAKPSFLQEEMRAYAYNAYDADRFMTCQANSRGAP